MHPLCVCTCGPGWWGQGEAQGCPQRKRGSHLWLAPCSLGHSPDPRLLQAGGAPVPRTPLRMAEPSSSWEGPGVSPTRRRHLLDPVCELRPQRNLPLTRGPTPPAGRFRAAGKAHRARGMGELQTLHHTAQGTAGHRTRGCCRRALRSVSHVPCTRPRVGTGMACSRDDHTDP